MKKRVLSILMMLCLALTLLPVSVWAADSDAEVSTQEDLNATLSNASVADSDAEVSTQEDLNAALSNASVTEIHIIADMTYNDPLNATKPVQVDQGVTLTLNNYQTTVSGTIINNGIIQVNSQKCS